MARQAQPQTPDLMSTHLSPRGRTSVRLASMWVGLLRAQPVRCKGCLLAAMLGAIASAALVLAGCSSNSTKPGQGATVITPTATATLLPAGIITEYPLPANSGPGDITSGPDGALWFTESDNGKIGRITPSGSITEHPLPAANSHPGGITSGPDGNLWFTEYVGSDPTGASMIARITPAGQITEYPLPTVGSYPAGITSGPDGALWFTESDNDKIGRITPSGSITEFPAANSAPLSGSPGDITSGPDGALWFTENIGKSGSGTIGRITPAGQITEYPLPANSGLAGITSGPDGALWFTEGGDNTIGRITA